MGWLTCAECSSLGLDTGIFGPGTEPPKTGTCASCGGPWPLRETTHAPFLPSDLHDPMSRPKYLELTKRFWENIKEKLRGS